MLGFEVLLGITVIYAGLSLLFPSNWQGRSLLALAVLLAGRDAVLVPDPRYGADPDAGAPGRAAEAPLAQRAAG